jgi:hypothetical protein
VADTDKHTDSARQAKVPDVASNVRQWRDKYSSRLEREMLIGFPLLEKALLEGLSENLGLLLPGRSEQLTTQVLEPEFHKWITHVVIPIIEDANSEYPIVAPADPARRVEGFEVSVMSEGVPMLALPLGGVVVWGGISAGMGAKGLAIFGITIGAAPASAAVLAVSAVVGSALMILGATRILYIRERIADLFSKSYIPKLKESIVGGSYDIDGVEHLSLVRQLQKAIHDRANELIAESSEP